MSEPDPDPWGPLGKFIESGLERQRRRTLPAYKFSINTWIHDEPDQAAAVEQFVGILSSQLRSGDLLIKGTDPDGKETLWQPERGKPADQWRLPDDE